jgi:uncharacterized protein (TIGR03067 family)
MTHSRFLLALAVLWLVPTTAPAQPLPVKTVEFNSESVGRKMKYNIVLPAKYDQTKDRYPVLYLLHGLTSNYTAWARMGVPDYARAYDLIVVMPDVGNSWYVNWAKSEDGQKNNWEDAIIKDLVNHVDATYRTIAKREGRAINGLSMGGFGGLMLGLRHADMFCSIGSHSGAIAYARQQAERIKAGKDAPKGKGPPSTTPDPKIGIDGFSSQAERTPKGVMFTTAEEATAYDPFALVLKLPRDKLPHIYLDCGTEDGLIKSNLEFAKLLMDNKIPHTFAQSPGGHNAPYWTREVGHSMAVQYAILQRNLTGGPKVGGGDKGDKGKGDKLDPAKLVGNWTFVAGVKGGDKMAAEALKDMKVIFAKDTLTLKSGDVSFVMKYEVDPKQNPAGIKLEITEGPVGVGSKSAGIIELNGDELRICYAAMGGDAPKTFESKAGSQDHLFTLKRAK